MLNISNLKEDSFGKLKSWFMESTNAINKQPESDPADSSGSSSESSEPRAADPYEKKLTSMRFFTAVLNGLGVGLLLGVLLGLAVSPVVSGVIGTLSSILLILLGLNDKQMTTIKSLRIGTFGIFAVVGIILGMYIRTTDALSYTTTELKDEYMRSGFSKDQALYYVALKKFKYVPVGWFGTSVADTAAMSTTDNHDQSVLFSSDVDLSQCRILNTSDATFPKDEIFNTFEAAGGVWEKLAVELEPEIPGQAYVDGLLGIRDSFCALGSSGEMTIEGNPELSKLSDANSSDEIKNVMRNSGQGWNAIAANTENKIPNEYQVKFYLTVIKILSNEKDN
ncbi:MAG: hypothetical protein K9H16_06975 [Bacteroidales bacterium]|nr:hypothetical protein [Bacteroidales bacterium]